MPSASYTSTAVTTDSDKWYYMKAGKKQGPVPAAKLTSMIESGELEPDTRVWTRGMANWAAASSVDALPKADSQREPANHTVPMNSTAKKKKKRKSNWWIWLIAVIVLIGAAAAVYFFFLKDHLSKSESAPSTPEPVATYEWDETVVFENDKCAFIIDSVCEKGDYLELDVSCVNKTKHVLSFTWECTSINGSMFDPLWDILVTTESTLKSSITFPRSLLEGQGLLPADELKFILCIYDETLANMVYEQASSHILDVGYGWYAEDGSYIDPTYIEEWTGEGNDAYPYWDHTQYQTVEGYDNYLFSNDVIVDEDGRPFLILVDKTIEVKEENADDSTTDRNSAELEIVGIENAESTEADAESATDETTADIELKENEFIVYFDEMFDRYGGPVYMETADFNYHRFYDDPYGRPYYFSDYGDTIYYEGYGFAFYDEESDRRYYYDEEGDPAYYGNSGNPEKYEGTVTEELLETAEPINTMGAYIVHEEYTIYPTDKDEDDIVRPERIATESEEVFWDGEKGTFIVLGTEMDEFEGFVVHLYIENRSDNFAYFSANNVAVNGVSFPDSEIRALRANSSCYWDIVIPKSMLEEAEIEEVKVIKCMMCAVGENMSVPLYPIEWNAP